MVQNSQGSHIRLVADIGNTRAKVAVFEGDQMVLLESFADPTPELFNSPGLAVYQPRAAIISSVAGDASAYMQMLPECRWINLSHDTPLPFTIQYDTPETLGRDRIAGVAGAWHLFQGSDLLVIDAGTAITYDFISKEGVYKGGAISPGITIRFRALNTFTSRLPLLNPAEISFLTGKTTDESILSGVMNGAKAEIDGIIEEYKAIYPELKIIITGGDMFYFEKKLKNNIFANSNLVIAGLKKILDYNLEK